MDSVQGTPLSSPPKEYSVGKEHSLGVDSKKGADELFRVVHDYNRPPGPTALSLKEWTITTLSGTWTQMKSLAAGAWKRGWIRYPLCAVALVAAVGTISIVAGGLINPSSVAWLNSSALTTTFTVLHSAGVGIIDAVKIMALPTLLTALLVTYG